MIKELIFNRISSRTAANGLFLLSLFFLLRNILKLGSLGFTGLIFGSLIPAIIFVAGLFILKPEFLLNLDWGNLQAKISYKIIMGSSLGLFFLYYLLNTFSFDLHTPLMMLLVFLSFAYLGMLYCQFSGKLDWAVYIFFICFPLLNLAEYWMGIVADAFDYTIIFTPTVFFLLSLFIGIIMASRKDKIILLFSQKAIFICLMVFLLSGLMSALLSVSPDESLRQYIIRYVYPLMMFPIVFFSINTISKIKTFINTLIISYLMNVVIFFYMYQRYGKGFYNLIDVYTASISSGIASGILAILILFIFPLIVLMLFIEQKKHLRKGYLIISLLSIILLLITFSRSALISFFTGGLILVIIKRTWQLYCMLAFSIMILVLIFSLDIYSPAFNRYLTLGSGLKNTSWLARANAWGGAMRMIREYPVFGIGAGLWGKYVANYCPTQYINLKITKSKWARGYILDPHNIFLSIYLETGLLGAICWLSLLIGTVSFAFYLILHKEPHFKHFLGLAYLLFIIINTTHHLSNSDLFGSVLFLYGCIFWGIQGMFIRSVSI